MWNKGKASSFDIFLSHMLRRMRMIDIPPIRLCSTWRNKRVGEDRIEKQLDHFLVSENLVEYCTQI
jgi:hypothetical protein